MGEHSFDMEMAMALNPDDIASQWTSSTDSYSSMQGNVLNSIFTTGDDRHFGIITQSTHANTHIDLQQLENYYNIPMENGDRIGVNVVLEQQNISVDPTTDPVDDTSNEADNENNGDDSSEESGRDAECPPNCVIESDVKDASSDEESLLGPKSLLLIIVIILLVSVGLLTRSSDENEEMDVDQTVIIEKEWSVDTKPFVPELPPLAPPPSNEEE